MLTIDANLTKKTSAFAGGPVKKAPTNNRGFASIVA
jgi:hypothetical protein